MTMPPAPSRTFTSGGHPDELDIMYEQLLRDMMTSSGADMNAASMHLTPEVSIFNFECVLMVQLRECMTFSCGNVGCVSFGPMAQCVVHALKGLACRAPDLLAHAEVRKTKKIFF